MNSTLPRLAAALTLAAGIGITAAIPAQASGGGQVVEDRGSCSGHSDWKLKAKADDGRLEVEAEVESNVNGQVWDWKIKDNGMLAATGSSTTTAPSGSFEVNRRIANRAGTDKITFKATNPDTGETCRGTVRF